MDFKDHTERAYFIEGKLRLRILNDLFKVGLDPFSCLLSKCSVHYIIIPSPLLNWKYMNLSVIILFFQKENEKHTLLWQSVPIC